MATERDPSHKEAALPVGPELRLLDRRAFVGFPSLTIAPGLTVSDFALQIPDVTFPFSFTGGASKYQKKKLGFGFLEIAVDAEVVARKVAQLDGRMGEVDELKLHFRPGYIEGQARLATGERAPVTFKLAFDGDGERLAVYVYDVRLYGFSTTPAAQLPVMVSRAVKALELLPDIELRGASGFSSRLLPSLVELAAVGRGYKMPALDQARLSAAEVTGQGLKLRFSAGGLPPPTAPDEELLLALEGARAFADAESLLAQGKLAEARDAYLRLGDVSEAHPFAIERLLTLLVADPQAQELALDVAQSLARRRERSATALWAEAVVRERRGESARAAERYLALCSLARRAQEDASAFFAAESAARAARDQAPQMAVKALHEVLGLKPDHLPSLKALARAADQAHDRAGAIRAFRRIAALARDPAEAADAHVHLARLCALTEEDIAGARLHCEAALRLSPNHPEALYQLGELCHRAGEHLRAIKSLDRLREVALGRHEVDRVGRANVLAGRVWEEGMNQAENALLRYREAISLLPGEPEPLYLAARAAEKLGKLQEAVSGYTQAIELAGPAPRDEEVRKVAHASHHAMARLYRTRLGEPVRVRDHLEAAFALDPRDLSAIEELLPYFRASGKTAELADGLEKAALVIEDPLRRAAMWAEAGELYRGRLSKPDRAEQLLSSAVEADPQNRTALEGLLALAETHRDGAQLCRCLKALAKLEQEPAARVRHLRRLAVAARDLAFDLDLAVEALKGVLAVETDDLPALGELCALERRRSDMNGLSAALEQRARVAETHGDKRLAAAALRELAQVLEARLGRVGEALVALERASRLSSDPALLLELAELSLRCDRPENARRALEDLLASMPQNSAPERVAEVRARLGRACERLGDKEAAKDHYAQAFPLRRTDEELATRLEALYEEGGETLRLAELWAARAQAHSTGEHPEDAAPLFLKSARALLRAGERSAAILRMNAALDAAPQGPLAGEILESMAELELERGARREAARLFARRAALVSDARPAARLYWRAAQLSHGQPREAEYLADALGREPRFSPARIRRAELQAETDPRAALEDLEMVLSLPQDDGDAPAPPLRLELTRKAAQAAILAGRGDTARRLLASYTAQRPEDLDAQRSLVELYRTASAREPLCDLLAEFWHRVTGAEQLRCLREYAELSLELGRPGAALDALRSLLELEPENLWGSGKLLALLPQDAPATERLALLSRLLGASQGQERAELLERRARLLRSESRLEEAATDLREAVSLAAEPAGLYRALCEVLRHCGQPHEELTAWQTAAAKAPALADEAAARILVLAEDAAAGDKPTLAHEAFVAALALPLVPDARARAAMGAAEAALALGNDAAALEAFATAAAQGPLNVRVSALLRHAALLEKAERIADAVVSLESALSLSPHHLEATSGLKRGYAALERWVPLSRLMAAEAAAAPVANAAALYAELGLLQRDRLGDAAAAEAALRKAAQLDEGRLDVRQALVSLVSARGEWIDALGFAESLVGQIPAADAAALLRTIGLAAQQKGAADLALKALRRALELLPGLDDEAMTSLAELLYQKGALREALPLVQRLADTTDFEATPEGAERLWLRLSDIAAQLDDVALAESALRRILQARPLAGEAAERLASLLEARSPRESIEVLWAWLETQDASTQTLSRLDALARRAREELADVELTAAILRRTAELSSDALGAHQSLVALFRDAGRTQELLAELLTVADLSLEAGDVDGAIAAFEEEARLAEGTGRIDEALKTLQALRELCEDEGDAARACAFELRRAELLRDAKLDLDGAEAALQKAFDLRKSLDTARQGEQLALRRADPAAQADWLERTLDLQADQAERARTFAALAALFEGPLDAPEQAEAAAREALANDPSLAEAQALLIRAYERDGRVVELAQHHEELAARAKDPATRVRLFLDAARIYRERAGRPDDAAAAVLAARAAQPDDLELTARCAELLHEAGRDSDAAEFDALLLEGDPFRPGVFERHVRHLESVREWADLAGLLLRRAERLKDEPAAEAYLAAADALRRGGAREQSQLCEERAFESWPGHDAAFEVVRTRATDLRRLSHVLAQRAAAVPEERIALLRERAQSLLDGGEALLAAEAFDDLLEASSVDLEALSARAELAARAGGALAAQPYDRKLLNAGGEALAVPMRVRAQLRLGHASLGSGALHDAADAFEAVIALDAEGEKGREALSLLAEVHARTNNADGLFRTSLMLAKRATGSEAEALYRRAAELFDEPARAVDAWVPLAQLRPADERVIERAAAGLKALGRADEVVSLLERSAQAVGGPTAAHWLLQAAQLVDSELADADRAHSLRERAGQADPSSLVAVRALAEGQRARGQVDALRETLERLVKLLGDGDGDEAALVRLELGALYAQRADDATARTQFEAVVSRGASGAGYAQALESLTPLLQRTSDFAALGRVLEARAALGSGEARAAVYLDASRAYRNAGDPARALRAVGEAVAVRPSLDALTLQAALYEDSGAPERAARAYLQAAPLADAAEAKVLWTSAIEALDAAGERDEAQEQLERIAADHPHVFAPMELASLFARIGASHRALEQGFGPALADGRFDDAVALADAAGDPERAIEALWAQVRGNPAGPQVDELARRLAAQGRPHEQVALAALCQAGGNGVQATALLEARALGSHGPSGRQALDALLAGSDPVATLARVLERMDRDAPYEVVDGVLTWARRSADEGETSILEQCADRFELRRPALLRELFERHREAGRFEAAAEVIDALVELDDDLQSRSGLHVELGEVYLNALKSPERAREAFEVALSEDLYSASATRHLVELAARAEDAPTLVAMAERLVRVAGPRAVEDVRPQLADAYQVVGRDADAFRLLGALPETPERILRRAELAERLGLPGEALMLREKIATTQEDLEAVLVGYLHLQLVPFAVRLGKRLHAEGQLSATARRALADRLSVIEAGAGLAVVLWPALLREAPADADGWTLFAEALRWVGRTDAADLADGFGAALAGSPQAACSPPFRALARPIGEFQHAPPAGALEVDAQSMPRLAATLTQTFEALGAGQMRVWLDPTGHVAAYLVAPDQVVIGAGALAVFGPVELSWLSALALALGEHGRTLQQLGRGPALDAAAVAAFAACPASLAACRVLALLDDSARGVDPASVDNGAVLRRSSAFVAIASCALELV